MNVMVIGSGGREDVISEAIHRSDKLGSLYAVMKNRNPGIASRCEDFLLAKETDVERVVDYALLKKIDLAVIGPEAPLEKGIVDSLEENGIDAIGPKKIPAKIETDKSWARQLMRDHNIEGCPEFGIFRDLEGVKEFLDDHREVVVKPSGLTGGKGVKVVGEHLKDKRDVITYIKEVLKKHESVVLEEKLDGEEFTIQAFTDGKDLIPSPAVQDHKRAYEGDKGPNTGGMGSYSDNGDILPFMERRDYDDAVKILERTLAAIREETGEKYKGVLYGQFMLCREGIKLIEYNARFGDPEAMNTIPILKTDLLDIFESILDERLNSLDIEHERKATVCKYVVPKGYPEDPKIDTVIKMSKRVERETDKGEMVANLRFANLKMGHFQMPRSKIFYSSVDERDGKIYTTSSRSLSVVGIADTIEEAEKIAEGELSKIEGEVFSRHDIGKESLIRKRIEHIKRLRG